MHEQEDGRGFTAEFPPNATGGAGDFLFVYGTLRRGFGSAEAVLLARASQHCGAASFQGRLFRAADFAAAVPSHKAEDRVLGDLYRLPAGRDLIEAIDAYEGYRPDFPTPALFVRRMAEVVSAQRGRIAAWIYLYNRDIAGLTRIADGDFLAAQPSART